MLSLTLLSSISFSSGLSLYLFLSIPSVFTFCPFPPDVYFIPLLCSYLIATCHSQSELFRYPEFPVSQAAGRRDKEKERGDDDDDDERRNYP